jgi:peptidoglycan-associated lipoprotein
MRTLPLTAARTRLLAAGTLLAAGCAHHVPLQVAAAPAPAAKAHSTAWEDSVILARMAVDQRNSEAKRAKAVADEKALMARMTFFSYDRAILSDSDRAVLDAKIPILRQDAALRIQIAGNCDDRGSDEYNLALGENRAAAAKRYLVDHGIAADQIEIISYGKERPMTDGTDDASRAENRNDQFVIIAGASTLAGRAN